MSIGDPEPTSDDSSPIGKPLPPEDRLWRHPSEMASRGARPDLNPIALPPAKRLTGILVAVAGLVGGLVGSIGTVSGLFALGAFDRTTQQVAVGAPVPTTRNASVIVPPPPVPTTGVSTTEPATIARQTGPALFRIEADGPQGKKVGTALVVQSGYVATSRELVQSATTISASADGIKKVKTELVGEDEWTNIAVLKVDAAILTPTWGNSSGLVAGDDVVIVGAAETPSKTPSVAVGVINNLRLRHTLDSGMILHDLLRTDTNLLPGSRGSVVAARSTGSVVGLVTTVGRDPTGVERIGLATPIETVRASAEAVIRTNGRPNEAWLGIEGETLLPEEADAMGVQGGVKIVRVRDQSPASIANLAPGDVIVAVNSNPIVGMNPLVMTLRSIGPGKPASLTFRRGTDPALSVLVILQYPPDDWPAGVR